MSSILDIWTLKKLSPLSIRCRRIPDCECSVCWLNMARLGAPAGTLSESLHIPHNTLSFHLSHMSHAGLVVSRREGRSIIYSANFEFFSGLIRYMVEGLLPRRICQHPRRQKAEMLDH